MSDRNPYLGWLLVLIASVIFLLLYRDVEGQQAGPELSVLEPLPQRTSEPGVLVSVHALRVAKCRLLVERLYPNSGFLPFVEFFIAEHERLGMGSAWYWSAVYGGANFSLQVGGVAPGNCAGPLDVKHWPLVRDPKANIRWHCREMSGFYKRGVRGIRLCYSVFLPAHPRDWGGGRFKRTDRQHRETINEAYRDGRL